MDARESIRFGPFVLDLVTLDLSRDGRRVPLPRQPASVLCLLAARPGEIVTRKEIQQSCWPDTPFVEDSTINAAIRQIRRALDDSSTGPRYIETLPKRGYRFLRNPQVPERRPWRAFRMASAPVLIGALVLLIAGSRPTRRGPAAAARLEHAKAVHFLESGEVPRSVTLFERAIALDGEFPEAHAGLADARLRMGDWKAARASALRALAIDEREAKAHFVLGHVDWFDAWNLASAEAKIRRATRLDPANPAYRVGLAFLLVSTSRADEAVALLRSAEEIDPLSPALRSDAGVAWFLARRYPDALRQCALAVEMDPSLVWAEDCVMDALVRLGRSRDAAARIKPALLRWKVDVRDLDWLRAGLAPEPLLEAYRTWRVARMERRGISTFGAATFYADLNMPDRAFDALDRAIRAREFMLLTLEEDPRFDLVRTDRRFLAILQRVRNLRGDAPAS